jgi:hypothetical protein
MDPPPQKSSTGSDHCGKITKDEIWAKDRNPHIVTCKVVVQGATLTIGPGVEVRVKQGMSLSTDGNKATPTRLHVLGSAAEPVLFTQLGGAAAKPHWLGISAWNSGPKDHVLLRHAIIEHTGPPSYPTVPWGALEASNAIVKVDSVTIRNNEGFGFYFVKNARFARGSQGLVSTKNTQSGLIEVSGAHTVPETGARLTGNQRDAVTVKGHGSRLVENVIWEDIGVPYFVDPAHGSSLIVAGKNADHPAALTLGPGVKLMFKGGGILVGWYGPAAMAVRGTRQRPVVISGWNGKDDKPTWWSGISFSYKSIAGASVLEHMNLGYGGIPNRIGGNLKMTASSPTVRNSVIHHSATWGIDKDRKSKPVLQNVRFSANKKGDVHTH